MATNGTPLGNNETKSRSITDFSHTYSSTETAKTGWDLTDLTCTGDQGTSQKSSGDKPTRTATFDVQPGEDITCTFTNTERGTVTVIKTVNGQAPTGSESFQFQLRQGASTASNGTILDTRNATAASPTITFQVNGTSKLLPGNYQICEFVKPGWKSTVQAMSGAFVPGTGGVTTADNTYICAPFTLSPGEDRVHRIDNIRPPGGMAKTIGFWKNWSGCSGGNQRPIMDITLSAMPNHGVYMGTLFVNTCTQAYRLLNKSRVSDGAKMASDAAFNLAAQLMAARLNFQAGAGTCNGQALSVANDAQNRLAALHFNGVTHDAISKSLATTLNSLATTLDKYNNNQLC